MSVSRGRSTPAIVLRARPVGESDLVVVLLTLASGKVSAAARGARRSKKRFPGGLPPGALGVATLAPGRGSLMRLEGFQSERDHGILGRDLERFAYVAYVCELTDELVLEHEADARLFARVHGTIARLCDGPPDPLELRRLELGLLAELGHLPALVACCVCGEPLDLEAGAVVGFDAGRGGALCPRHRGGATGVRPATLGLAARLVDGPPGPGKAALEETNRVPAPVRQGVRDLVVRVLRLHLRRPLRSTEFFRRLRKPPSEDGTQDPPGEAP